MLRTAVGEIRLSQDSIAKIESTKVALASRYEQYYDLTVVAAGNVQSGVRYILKPQAGQSGSGHEFNEVL